jgi:hypothetical protein
LSEYTVLEGTVSAADLYCGIVRVVLDGHELFISDGEPHLFIGARARVLVENLGDTLEESPAEVLAVQVLPGGGVYYKGPQPFGVLALVSAFETALALHGIGLLFVPGLVTLSLLLYLVMQKNRVLLAFQQYSLRQAGAASS